MTSSQVYSHRSLQPTTGRSQTTSGMHASHARLHDSFDIIRQEMETTSIELEKLRAQRDDYEKKVNAQLHELSLLRRSFFDLENQHIKLRQQYEDEVNRLKSEMSRFRPVSGSLLSLASNSGVPSDARDNGRDRARTEREKRILVPPYARAIDPEREIDRLTDHRSAKRLKSRTDQTVGSPIRVDSPPKHPSANAMGPPGVVTSISPKTAVPSPGECPTGTRTNQFQEAQEAQSDGSWTVVHNPKVPKMLDVSLLHTLKHGSVVCCVQFSPDGKYVATGCNRSARIYDAKTGQQKCCLIDDSVAGMSDDLYIRSVRFSPDGKYLATGAEDRKIRIWDIAKKRIRKVFEGHQEEIYCLDFSRDGRLIVSGSGDRTARIWDLENGSCNVFTVPKLDEVVNPQDAGVTSVAVSHDSRLLAAGSLDSITRIWDVATGHLLARLRGHADSVYSVTFSADGRGIVSGSLDKTLKYWDISSIIQKVYHGPSPKIGSDTKPSPLSEKPVLLPSTMDMVGHKDFVLTVAVSKDGNWVVSGSKDRCVHFWNAQNGDLQLSLQGHKNSVISLDLNPSSGLLVTGSGDYCARIWTYRPQIR
ncbi:hypothetical protein APHAL10511_003498 [Amanita phalloides]|nr:hypothetical protein APHAL10511_003498 [Amanita phalloides]